MLTEKALRDIDGIYSYIAGVLLEPGTAESVVSALEEGIFSLEVMPFRCPERRRGRYGSKGYRRLFVKNYTVI